MRAAFAVQGIGFLVIVGALVYLVSQSGRHENVPVPTTTSTTMNASTAQPEEHMMLITPAFVHEEQIPSKYTCDGDDMSPPLAIDNVPDAAQSLALIVNDPDAPAMESGWDHWIVFNIPPETSRIGEGEEPDGVSGTNSWGRLGYGGPCPPKGEHRYLFKLFALDTMLELNEGATKAQLLEAMAEHVLERATLMGRYSRDDIIEP